MSSRIVHAVRNKPLDGIRQCLDRPVPELPVGQHPGWPVMVGLPGKVPVNLGTQVKEINGI
jgi:hypothetical protein